MKPSLYNLIIGVFALIVLLLPFFGKLNDGRYKFPKGIRTRGWIVIAAFICSIFFSYLKDVTVENEENTQAEIVKNDKRIADSISRVRNDESNVKIINSFTSTLAEYGLKYDSTEKVIAKIVRDSSKKQIVYLNETDPVAFIGEIREIEPNQDSIMLNISIGASHKEIYNLNTALYILLVSDENEILSLLRIPNFQAEVNIPLNIFSNQKISYFPPKIKNTLKKPRRIYLVFDGKYKDRKENEFKFKEMAVFNTSLNSYGSVEPIIKNKIITFLAARRIIY